MRNTLLPNMEPLHRFLTIVLFRERIFFLHPNLGFHFYISFFSNFNIIIYQESKMKLKWNDM